MQTGPLCGGHKPILMCWVPKRSLRTSVFFSDGPVTVQWLGDIAVIETYDCKRYMADLNILTGGYFEGFVVWCLAWWGANTVILACK